MNEHQLDQALAQLKQDIAPERDLWPDIEARLTAQPDKTSQSTERPWLLRWAAIAAVTLMTLVSWQIAILPTAAERSAALPSAELMLIQAYETQKARQLAQVVAVAEGFDKWQQQVQIWDQAIEQVRRALTIYPDEPQLLAQLQLLYQQQLSFIQKATLQTPILIS